jgi:hypothetical protein
MAHPVPLPTDSAVFAHREVPALARTVDELLRKVPGRLEFLAVAETFSEVRICERDGVPWLVGPAQSDPFVAQGKLPIPAVAHRKLKGLRRSKVDFDAIYIAHELDRARVERVLGCVPTGSRVVRTSVAVELVDAPPEPAAAVRAAEGLGKIAGGVNVAIVASVPLVVGVAAAPALGAVAVAGALSTGLDPMIIGVVTADGSTEAGTPGAWFVLAHWTW